MHGGDAYGRRSRRRVRPNAEINMTSLIDIMLVLLIVFMIAAPMLTSGVAVDLPQAESSPLPGQDEPLSVTVDRTGRIWLQDSEIALDQLGPRLTAITGRKPDARIFVRGDKGIDYGTVMQVVSTINQAGFSKVALLTDGRMSGASGKVPAAIHLTPEAADGGPIARIRDGDVIRLDAAAGRLEVLVGAAEWAAREPERADLSHYHRGLGRELFEPFRAAVGPADQGAAVVGNLVAA